MLTAYDYNTAKLTDEAGVDLILIGDSLGMVILGYENTLPVTVGDVLYHTRAVSRATKEAVVVADMPFMSYTISKEKTLENAGLLIQQGGATAVKIEGGEEVGDSVKALVASSIPVMGHVGLAPQSINSIGENKVQGKSVDEAKKIIADAVALEKAGVFALVLECVPYKLAQYITQQVSVPTIGIGSGQYTDGQVLVTHDLLGITEKKLKFVKQYKDFSQEMNRVFAQFINDVKQEEFPQKEHSFIIEDEVMNKIIDGD